MLNIFLLCDIYNETPGPVLVREAFKKMIKFANLSHYGGWVFTQIPISQQVLKSA